MSKVLESFRAAREARDLERIARGIPYANLLGIGFRIAEDDALVGHMDFADHVVGNASIPALHGGAIGSLLESVAIFEVLWRLDLAALPKTINITFDYLRSARPEDTFATARITKDGRRVVNVSVDAWQSDRARPVASAHVHLLVQRPE